MPSPVFTAAPWVFSGLRLRPGCIATARRANGWRMAGGEWVRPVAGPADWRACWEAGVPPLRRWAVDFPPGADERAFTEAGVAGRAFVRAGGRIVRRGAGAELRIALAKCDRFLAAPSGGRAGRWRWLPTPTLPVGALVVVALDDEFLAGVLASHWLRVWAGGRGGRFGAEAVRTLPLPWDLAALRSGLTREQEERRGAVVRAWRSLGAGSEDIAPESWPAQDLNAAVAQAYGWPASIGGDDAFGRLQAMAQSG